MCIQCYMCLNLTLLHCFLIGPLWLSLSCIFAISLTICVVRQFQLVLLFILELSVLCFDYLYFQVDLEHNQYRSFQGITCLIQISTRTEDFIIDALKLRIQIGPFLREVFRDPSKRKVNLLHIYVSGSKTELHHLIARFILNQVMHGADRDIMWLQRDFGIYICNLFDTGQVLLHKTIGYQYLVWILYRLNMLCQ